MTKKITVAAIFFITIFNYYDNVKAFQSVSHYIIINQSSKMLTKNSVIRKAIEKYPSIAAWGSIAPDLGYHQLSTLINYSPWADRYHYYKVGSYAATQLKNALQSKDMKKIAFAAGWVSHISGDLACHGIYINPECGVYLNNVKGRKLHTQMEEEAEPYAWVNIGQYNIKDYNSNNISNNIFKDIEKIPFDLMNKTSVEVYGSSPSITEEKLCSKILITKIKTGIGYRYIDYNMSKKFLETNTRKERLEKAFKASENQCAKLLSCAENGNYGEFTDRWNLDVGISDSPISSLTVIITTGKEFGAGTDDNIYFGIQMKNGKSKEWLLDKPGYNDFENGDSDEYYLYINDRSFMPSMVNKAWVRKENNGSLFSDWLFKSFEINVNGKIVSSNSPNKWLTKKDNILKFNVNWSMLSNEQNKTVTKK